MKVTLKKNYYGSVYLQMRLNDRGYLVGFEIDDILRRCPRIASHFPLKLDNMERLNVIRLPSDSQ